MGALMRACRAGRVGMRSRPGGCVGTPAGSDERLNHIALLGGKRLCWRVGPELLGEQLPDLEGAEGQEAGSDVQRWNDANPQV